ncbi:hypothetical protein [Buttiauxella noackiae]|uniref:hypothetical protein n=1 Tax=Buttiauxella noackiae TaxID=82992 RepID=UPI0028D78355|nr:hypothetical protein [Buttiauxella noackiae]
METYKCCLCKKEMDGNSAYEYRGFTSCADCFDQVIEKVDIRRGEIIARNEAVTAPLAGLDIHPGSVIGKANRKLLAPAIEASSKETLAELQYRAGKL